VKTESNKGYAAIGRNRRQTIGFLEGSALSKKGVYSGERALERYVQSTGVLVGNLAVTNGKNCKIIL
jgi:hypothetical protein